ncbi:MAG: CPBP family intramembrane metalloprotease [Chloroflexota bacterium]|nr:CPBP family intramembrane metalloprotease [Chloroflexota bacterium]
MMTRTGAALAWVSYCGYLVAIVTIELVTTFLSTQVGMGAQLALMTILLIDASVARRDERTLLVALLFAPLIRVASLALPFAAVPVIAWYALICLPLGVAVIFAARILGLSRQDFGLRGGHVLAQIGIGLLGIPLGAMSYVLLRPASLIADLHWQTILAPALILLVSTGLLEELIFRGLLQSAVETVLGRWGIVYSSAVFAALQIGNRSPLAVAFAFLVGFVFAWCVRRTHSISGAAIAHGLMSVGAYLVLPHLIGSGSL